MKKSLLFCISSSCLLGWALIWGVLQIDSPKNFITEDCPFCQRRVIENQAVYQENGCIALLSYKPAIKGHMLIIPERHVERFEDLTEDELVKIHAMIAKVDRAERNIFGSTGYVLLQKNGIEAGQSVPHVHFHYFQRSPGDSHIWLGLRIIISSWSKPITAEEINNLRSEFQRHGLAD